MVKERKEKFKTTYTRNNIIGTCLCILSLIPLFAGATISEDDELLLTLMLSITLVLAGIGAVFLIRVGVIQASYEKLLQEGDYTRLKKKNRPITATVAIVYWLTATAIFLILLFIPRIKFHTLEISFNDSWIVWPIAGVLYPAVAAVTKALVNRRKNP